jgi:diaminopimelate epimerase
MTELRFCKYSACGNDFIMVDDRAEVWIKALGPKVIARLCHRRFGIGADGLIVLQQSKQASIRMRYFNADGTEGEVQTFALS